MKSRTRYLLSMGVLLLAFAALAGFALLGSGSLAVAAPGAAPIKPMAGAPMTPLPEAVCNVVDTTRTCELWALPGSLSLPGGATVAVWGFASSAAGPALVPGPVIRANQGETLQVVLHNGIGQNLSLAFPGQEGLIPDLTGVAPAGTATYTLPGLLAGSYLYEAGPTADGARQVTMGLFAPLVVQAAAVPVWNQEQVLVFSEVDPAFNADPANFSLIQFKPKYWLINGKAYPDTGWIEVAAGSTVLMRYLNAGVDYRSVGLLGLDQEVLFAGNRSLPFPHGSVAEPLAPGEVKEALIRVPADVVAATLYPLYHASLSQHNNNQRLPDMRAAFGGMLAFLKTTGGTTPGGQGPVASAVSVSPSKTNGTVDVILSATLTDGDSSVVAFEYFVDVAGAAGTGTQVTVSPPSSPVTVQQVFTAATLATWSSGDHTLYVRGQDGLGNWGTLGSAVLSLDKAGPAISGLSLKPNPSNGSVAVALSGTADDRGTGNSNVVAAEYRIAGGAWQPMALSASGSPVTGLTVTISAATLGALPEGVKTVDVRAQDDFSNWSATYGTIQLNLDKTGPNTTAVSLNPNSLDFSQPITVTSVRLSATVSDPLAGGVQSTLAKAEAFIDKVGNPGTGISMFPLDGLFDEATEEVYYEIPVNHFAGMKNGTYQVYVRGQDSAGNWGATASASIQIKASKGRR